MTPPLTIRGGRGRGQKRKGDKVLRSRYAFRPNKPIKVTVKTRRRVADCARSRKVHRSDFTLQGHPQKCPQEIFGEEEKPQGGLGGQASLVCLPASARFDEVRTQDAPLYAFRSVERIRQPLKRVDTSKTRRTRLSAGERTQMYVTQGKRSPTMYCAVYTRFACSKRNVNR